MPIKFGTSGWRSVLAEDFTFGNARRVVAAIARVLASADRPGGLVLVGYDTRFLADRFAAEAARILIRHGFPAEVGARPVPTPVLAFEIRRRGAAGAINFTASHNPPRYLGIKFSTSDGAPALPEITTKIEEEIARFPEEPAPPGGSVPRFDPAPRISWRTSKPRSTAGDVGARAVRASASTFASGPRPGSSTRTSKRRARRSRASTPTRTRSSAESRRSAASPSSPSSPRSSVRAAPGWASRATGTPTASESSTRPAPTCSPNEILSLLAADLVGRKGRPRGGIARSVATTHALDAIAARAGVPLYETPWGSSTSASCSSRAKIIFGGEESAGLTVEGHVPEKDGILADLLAAELVGATGKTIGQLRAELWKEIGPFLTCRIDLELSAEARARLAERKRTPPESVAGRRVASVNAIDGIKLIFEDGSWILVRESGTEPVARVYIEAPSSSELDALAKAGRELIA